MTKKILIFVVTICCAINFFVFSELTEGFPYLPDNSSTENSKIIVKESFLGDESNTWIVDQFLEEVWIKKYSSENWSAVSYIQEVVNYFLSILAFVALVVLIYGFYLLLFSWQWFDEWYRKAKKYIFVSGFSIIVIWVSWLIVSWLFYIVSKWSS